MRKVLKLTRLSKKEIEKVKGGMRKDNGGEVIVCSCGCGYVHCGGSSMHANASKNAENGFDETCYGNCC